jgi:outer membrane protein TolC
MNRSITSVLSAALLLGGCTGPRYRRPDVPVPPSCRGDTLTPGAANNSETGSLGELRWQDLIQDEELSKLIQEALSNNFDAQIAAARAGLLASVEARRVVLQTLVGEVAGAYFLLRDLDLELEITQRALKLREDSLELVQLRVDNGYSSEMDLRQAEVLVKSARTALTGLELQNEQAEN